MFSEIQYPTPAFVHVASFAFAIYDPPSQCILHSLMDVFPVSTSASYPGGQGTHSLLSRYVAFSHVIGVQIGLYWPLFCIFSYPVLHVVVYVQTLFTTPLYSHVAFVASHAAHCDHCAVNVLSSGYSYINAVCADNTSLVPDTPQPVKI